MHLVEKPVFPLVCSIPRRKEEVNAVSNQTILYIVFMAEDLHTIKNLRFGSENMGDAN